MTEHPFHASVAKVEPVGGLHAAIDWLRANLFNTWYNAVLTVLIVWALFAVLPDVMQWLIGGAEWAPDPQACRHAAGACWGFVAEKYRLILFGTYPFDEQWRPLAAMALFVALIALTCNRRFWKPSLAGAWAMGIVVISVLMWGGVLGLSYVDNLRWGGLPLTLILSTVGLLFAFPFAILLALGRRSDLPAIRAVCVAYIELVRGVPLISVLFMASVMFPLFLPDGVTIDKLLRAQVGIILFAAAYLAPVSCQRPRRSPTRWGGVRPAPTSFPGLPMESTRANASHRAGRLRTLGSLLPCFARSLPASSGTRSSRGPSSMPRGKVHPALAG